MLLGTF
ncbi:hypothetical protein GMOD_00009215 [Pyrenophora seminiperda CCB06]|nr:hypothetical protein GMOD_00009215 [Pyrenophora seminiperda CCB06]